jgi:hypothetical protein
MIESNSHDSAGGDETIAPLIFQFAVVGDCGLLASGCGLRAAGCWLRVAGCGLWAALGHWATGPALGWLGWLGAWLRVGLRARFLSAILSSRSHVPWVLHALVLAGMFRQAMSSEECKHFHFGIWIAFMFNMHLVGQSLFRDWDEKVSK